MAARKPPARGQLRSRNELRAAAHRRGRAGNSATDWIRADPGHLAAYDQGRAEFADQLDQRPVAPHLPPPAPSRFASTATAAQGKADRIVGGPQLRKSFSSAGDGGGLLLAFVLYPIALSILKHGAAGPGLWFRAKWLNETTAQPNNLAAVIGTNGGPQYHSSKTTPGVTYDPNAKPGTAGPGTTIPANTPVSGPI